MRDIRHPLSGSIYGLDGDLVRVEKGEGVGWFDRDGRWQRGDIRTADAELCRWILTRSALPSGRRRFAAPPNSGDVG